MKGLYYSRTDSLKKGESLKDVERVALIDYEEEEEDCVSCQG